MVFKYFWPGIVYIYTHINRVLIVRISNELNEETAKNRELILACGVFWLWLHQVLTSEENVDSSWNYDVIVAYL